MSASGGLDIQRDGHALKARNKFCCYAQQSRWNPRANCRKFRYRNALIAHARNVAVNMQNSDLVPSDFPRESWPTALSGVQNKLSVRLVNGQYVAGLTDEERAERFAICEDLVKQLVAYCRRKHTERPGEPIETLWTRVETARRAKGGDASHVALTLGFYIVKYRL